MFLGTFAEGVADRVEIGEAGAAGRLDVVAFAEFVPAAEKLMLVPMRGEWSLDPKV